jgi:hypothetical protein
MEICLHLVFRGIVPIGVSLVKDPNLVWGGRCVPLLASVKDSHLLALVLEEKTPVWLFLCGV